MYSKDDCKIAGPHHKMYIKNRDGCSFIYTKNELKEISDSNVRKHWLTQSEMSTGP